jgi:4-amino-4-deoxy-L-arabinose transferase-like glycosyltransferase
VDLRSAHTLGDQAASRPTRAWWRAQQFPFESSVPWIACCWLTLVLLLRWPVFWNPGIVSDSPLDAAFFGYAGELVRLGGTPYLTFWDHKGPLIFWLDAAALVISGGRVWGLWLLNLAAIVGATVLGHAAMKRAFGPLAAALGTVCFACSLAITLPINMTEGFAPPLQWAVVALLVRWQSGDWQGRALAAFGAGVGVLGALAFFLRANLIGAALTVGLVVVATLVAQRRWRECLAFMASGVAGAAGITILITAVLASAGALRPFWDQAFHYNFVYAAATLRSRLGALYFGTGLATRFVSAAVPVAGWILCARHVRAARRGMQVPPVILLALLWLPLELLLGSASGRQYAHYFAPAFAPVALLAAAFVAEVVATVPPLATGRGVGVLRLFTVCTALWAMASAAMNIAKDKDGRERVVQASEAAAYVRAATPADARLLVWGHAADVHFFSGRRPASRFIYALPLLTPNYADAALVRGFIDEVAASAPPLIIDATPNAIEGEDLAPSLAAWNPAWKYPKDAPSGPLWWSMTPELRSFYQYVHANYTPVASIGPRQWVVYRRSGTAAPAGAIEGR